MRAKGSFTIEAALVVPFLCLLLCAILLFTLSLYQKVGDFAESASEKVERGWRNVEIIRLLRVVGD